MVINLSDLKVILQEKVLSLVDHKNLDLDVPYFKEGSFISSLVFSPFFQSLMIES